MATLSYCLTSRAGLTDGHQLMIKICLPSMGDGYALPRPPDRGSIKSQRHNQLIIMIISPQLACRYTVHVARYSLHNDNVPLTTKCGKHGGTRNLCMVAMQIKSILAFNILVDGQWKYTGSATHLGQKYTIFAYYIECAQGSSKNIT